ncbi:MAG TPA: DMT family transporter [Burkholderiaceae bacterium]|nr:DMT family transporter [Burkholderiaceae bacterium]
MPRPAEGAAATGWVAAAPALFVLIWSTGFVVARYGMPYAPPLGFLAVRYALSVLLFLVWVRAARARWPRGAAQWGHLAVTGVLMHAGYLGGVWSAVKLGMGAGTVALIVGLQPLLTAIWIAGRGHEQVRARQWLGLVLGLSGLILVVERKLGAGEVGLASLALALLALGSITSGTLYQKRHVAPGDVRTANTVQLMAALLVTAPLAWLETGGMQWHAELVGAMAWSVLVLTLGGSSLLTLLIQRGAATRVTSLLYLVPPCTAVLAWLLFREPLTPSVLAGIALAALGVSLVVRNSR